MHVSSHRATALALLAVAAAMAVLAIGGAASAEARLAQSEPTVPAPTATPTPNLRFPLIMRDAPGETGVVAGWVVDATSNEPIADARVCGSGGSACVRTDTEGDYRLAGVPVGASNLRLTATGYSTLTTRVDIMAGETLTRALALSPPLDAGQWRFVLTWDAQPPDLDAFLWLPDGQAVFWGGRGDCDPNPPSTPVGACLEQDSRDGYGPETMTITDLRGGGYYTLGVHRYDDPSDTVTEPSITTSGARLHVYDSDGLRLEFRIPAEGEGQFWYVLDLDATGLLTPYNAVSDHNPYAALSGAFSIQQHGLPLKDR
jgi:hypothetical protein